MVKLRRILVVLILSALAVIMVLPIVLTVTRSFEPGLVGYSDFFLWKPYYLRLFCNSLLIASVGAVGNVIDRFMLGYVRDMIQFTFVNFAVFNVADSFACIGAVLLGVFLLFKWDRIKARQAQKE